MKGVTNGCNGAMKGVTNGCDEAMKGVTNGCDGATKKGENDGQWATEGGGIVDHSGRQQAHAHSYCHLPGMHEEHSLLREP